MRTALRSLVTVIAVLAPPAAGSDANAASGPGVCRGTLANAHVFTGNGFEQRDLAIRDGRIVAADATLPRIDATSWWLIPPLVDAHTHAIKPPSADNMASHRRWIDGGIFYALNPNDIRPAGPGAAPRDDTVDLADAGGGLTRPGGHPTQLYPAGMDGTAYHLVSDAAGARAAVAKVKANGSAFVKLYLLNHADPSGGDGLSRDSFLAAVADAKRLGLRPIVHVEDAADFRLAVSAGVFALMHLPYWPPSAPPKRPAAALTIDRADAEAAAKAGIIMVPTAILSMAQFDGAELAAIRDIERHNLEVLRAAHVRLATGEDFIGDLHDEIAALRSFALFDRAEMLRMATENGAALAFPGRRIGRLLPGYEASLLLYRQDPTANWITLRTPAAGIRAGRVLIDRDRALLAICGASTPQD